MKFLTAATFFTLSVILQHFWIKYQQKIHLTQIQKWYGVNIDNEIKAATPSMGGLIFLLMGLLALMMDFSLDAAIFWSLPILSGLIGFADDWMKFRSHTSEGFSSLAKLKLQLLLCALWVMAVFVRGDLGLWHGIFDGCSWIVIPVSFLITAGTINAVNITDGLDGLAAGSFLISLAAQFADNASAFRNDSGLHVLQRKAGKNFHG